MPAGSQAPMIMLCFEWAARDDRVLISHDVATLGRHVWERVAAGQPTSGVFEIPSDVPVGRAIEDLLLIAE